jgi:hypothetical protein
MAGSTGYPTAEQVLAIQEYLAKAKQLPEAE